MTWTIEFDQESVKQLRKLDQPVARRIVAYLEDLITTGDPRARGEGVTGNLVGFWRYRVGDWRVICEILDTRMIIYVLEVGPRRAIYR